MGNFSIQTGNGDVVVYTDETKHKEMRQRAKRNSLLAQSDSIMVSDRGFTDAKKTEWVTYRQQLRDMDFSDPDKITWPTNPE